MTHTNTNDTQTDIQLHFQIDDDTFACNATHKHYTQTKKHKTHNNKKYDALYEK